MPNFAMCVPLCGPPAMLQDNIRHYRRRVCFHIAEEVRQIIGRRCTVKSDRMANLLQACSVYFKGGLWSARERLRHSFAAKGRV